MTQLRTLHLYGDLANQYGKKHKIVANASFHEAIRILDCNHPGFLKRVSRSQWYCLRGDRTIKRSLEMHPTTIMIPVQGDLHLLPAVEGGKSRGMKIVFSIIIGGALLATGIGGALGVFGGSAVAAATTTGAGLAATTGFLGITWGTVALMGAGLLLGGISMLLTPVPKDTNTDRKQDSWTLNGPVNVGDEGVAVPLAYGELIVGGVTIASAIVNGSGNEQNLAPSKSYTYSGITGGGWTTGGSFQSHDYSIRNN